MMALLQRLRGLSQSCSEGWNLFIRVKLQARGMSSYSRLYYDEWLIQEFPSSLLHQIHTEEHNVDSTGPRGITCFSSASVYPDRQADELCRLSSSSVFLECVIKQKYYPRLLHGNVLGRLSWEQHLLCSQGILMGKQRSLSLIHEWHRCYWLLHGAEECESNSLETNSNSWEHVLTVFH